MRPSEPASSFAQTMPLAARGQWRRGDPSRPPTTADCTTANSDIAKVLDMRDAGYGGIGTGRRIVALHNRTNTMIDAMSDTTYVDTPTTARKDFAAQPGRTLIVNDHSEDGRLSARSHRRCPE